MRVEKNVPEIRFEGFSGEWAQRPFGDCFDNIPNNTLSRADLNYEHGIAKNVHYGDVLIKFGEILDASDTSIPFVTDENVVGKQKHAALKNGDIVIADAAEDSTVGKCTELFNIDEQVILSGLHTIAVRPNLPFASKYLGYYLNSSSYHDQLLPLMQGTKVLSISKTALKNTSVNFPSANEEQTAIGNTFQKLDNLINQHQQKHDKLSNIKKAMLEKMFPKQGETMPEIRFKGFSGEWEEIELSDEVTFINGRAYSQEELLDKGKYTVLRVGNFYTNSSWYYSDLELGDKYYADNGDLLYTWSASFGPHIWNGDKVIYHYHIWKLELSENVDKLFLLHLLDYDRAKILSGSNGSTMIHITKSAMEAKKVFIPKKDEQIVIGNYFQKLDVLIKHHQQQITKLNNIKQACLSKMFV
ncbi:restriction endonuclease subunit S [Vibrio alginolyticus]|nr:restriction endonuclease subunit S [Vibrio parahaemolyticus]